MKINHIVIFLTIVAYLLQQTSENSNLIFGLNFYFFQGLYWQILTTMFVHGGILHLAMNMAVLYQFGGMIEENRGRFVYIVLYFGGGVLTSLLNIIFMYFFGLNHILVGASGAISVLIGYIAFWDKFNRKGLFIWILAISFLPLLVGMPIAWYAHIIGFLLGFVVAKILK